MYRLTLSNEQGILPHCSIDDCTRQVIARAMCDMHWQRWRATVDIDAVHQQDIERKFWLRVQKPVDASQCWLWTGAHTELGYGLFRVRTKKIYAHRYSYFLANGKWAEPMTLHSCDNPQCVNPAHLREGTHQDNMQDIDARNRRTVSRGSQIGTSVLTESQVAIIKTLCNVSSNRQFLKQTFKVSDTTISHIRLGKSWKHVLPAIL